MNNTIDQQFVEYIVKSLVNNPDKVVVERRIDEKGVLLELTVDPDDLGRVIGKRGATAQSLRTLLRALGTKNDARYNLKIVDVGEAPGPRSNKSDDEQVESGTDQAQESQDTQEPTDESDNDEEVQDQDNEDQDEDNDVVSRTRKELADLDDLDV